MYGIFQSYLALSTFFYRFLGFGRLCVDLRRDCKQHAANGACTNKWASYMAKNCGKSCKAAGVDVRCDEKGMKPKGECTNPLGMYNLGAKVK